MMRRTTWKRAALAGVLLVLLLGISGCLNKPDTIDAQPTQPLPEVLPFEVSTPSPSPAPTDEVDWSQWGGEDPAVAVTSGAATATAPIALWTPTPTPIPQWTYSPPPATPTPTADSTLRYGSTGQAVRNLQQRLKDLGYYSGSVDGDFGSGTKSALEEFQRVNGLTADGIAGSRTLSAIGSSSAKSKPKATATAKPTQNPSFATNRPPMKSYTPSEPGKYGYLQLGSSGSDVTKLQNRLKDLGYFKGTVNGKFGDDTEAAVLAFQERNGIWVDGVAGPDTQKEIYSTTALPARSGSQAPATSYIALDSGAQGDTVRALQNRLKEMGYFTGTVDGKYGPSTVDAIRAFQEVNGLSADGVAGVATQTRLYSTLALYAPVETAQVSAQTVSAQTLELGSTGEEVYRLQERLYDLGYYTGRIDGIYSDAVVTAVRAFQRANTLTSDGKAGRTTQVRLFSDKAIAAKNVDDTYTTLKEGDQDERVRALQSLLESYGYFKGSINGVYGSDTTAAVAALQRQNGLQADGIAGPATQMLLYEGSPRYAATEDSVALAAAQADSAPQTSYAALSQGMDSPDVMMLQQFLQELGYDITETDGKFGPSTLLAVQAFQEQNGMEPTGTADNDMLALLYSGTGSPADTFGYTPVETPERDTMRAGDRGQDVFTMQERLRVLGFLTEEPDGVYGTTTTAAVSAFQGSNGLKADGVAGPQTVAAMYAAQVTPAIAVAQTLLEYGEVDNRQRELDEQATLGALQVNLGGGGVAASTGSAVYYTGTGGSLYRSSTSGSDRKLYDGRVSYIHADDVGVTFAADDKILRIPANGTTTETLAKAGSLKKLAVIGDTLIYLDGSALVRKSPKVDAKTIATNVTDFAIDIYQYVAYAAGKDGVISVGLNGNAPERVLSTPVDQIQIAESVIFLRSGGDIYRLEDGIASLILNAGASWMGVYRDKVYYLAGDVLYRCDTDGKNSETFYSGKVTGVSFVAGKAYLTERSGGAVTQILPVE